MSKRYAIHYIYRDSQSSTEYEYVSEERYKSRLEAGSALTASVWVRGTESLRGGLVEDGRIQVTDAANRRFHRAFGKTGKHSKTGNRKRR